MCDKTLADTCIGGIKKMDNSSSAVINDLVESEAQLLYITKSVEAHFDMEADVS